MVIKELSHVYSLTSLVLSVELWTNSLKYGTSQVEKYKNTTTIKHTCSIKIGKVYFSKVITSCYCTQCLRTIDWIRFEGHTGVVRHLQADCWKIVSAADDKTLKVRD